MSAHVEVKPVGAEDASVVHEVVRAAFEARPALDPPAAALTETLEELEARLAVHGGLLARVVTDLFAFGDQVPEAYVDFVDSMLSQTPFEVVAEFFPSFHGLDKFDAVEVLGRVPTAVICGTADRLTSVGHSRKLHELVPGSTLLECENAGHMVILERHGQVNAALDQLLSAAAERVGLR